MRNVTCNMCGHYQDAQCSKLLPECKVTVAEDRVACCFFESTCVRCGARATVFRYDITPVVGWRPKENRRRDGGTTLPLSDRAYCAKCAEELNV